MTKRLQTLFTATRGARTSQHARRAFSLLDLLVVVAIIGVLMTIMLPVLTHAKESTRRVVCRSNVRQFGLAIALYASEHKDRLPGSVFSSTPEPAQFLPQEMIALHLFDGNDWDGLGRLYSAEYLPVAEIFYCPSHSGLHAFDTYAENWATRTGDILGNYHYRALLPSQLHIQDLHPRTALVADGMREASDINHKGGMNVLRVDQSVEWFVDPTGELLPTIPSSAAAAGAPSASAQQQALAIARAWWLIETGSTASFPNYAWAQPNPSGGSPIGGLVSLP